jgi:hypothetical protein
LRLVVKVTTVSQLVDELSRFTDAEQWLIVAFVALMVVVFTCWVGFAVVLVTRTVLNEAGEAVRDLLHLFQKYRETPAYEPVRDRLQPPTASQLAKRVERAERV